MHGEEVLKRRWLSVEKPVAPVRTAAFLSHLKIGQTSRVGGWGRDNYFEHLET